jgi:hypothetical protein
MDAQLRELRKDEIEKIESPIIEQVDILAVAGVDI